MQPGTLRVDDVAAGGDGIARADDGRIVFVRGGIPGDEVNVEVVKDRPTSQHAVVREVVVASPDRVDPPCPHVAAGCGGCGWQHVALDAQRRNKVRLLEESLRRIGRVDGEVEPGPDLPATGFRTSIRVLLTADGPAFRAAASHAPVPVDSCLVAHPTLAALLEPDVGLGSDGEVTLRVSAATGERLAVYEPSVPEGVSLPPDVMVVGVDELRGGRSAWFTEEVGGHRFRVSARSFFQTRIDGAEALVAEVGRAIGAEDDGPLLDLYGGVGLFAATVGRGRAVTLVEASGSSVRDARHNLADTGATVVHSPVERWTPVPAAVVIADPPRAGLGREGVAVVAASGADRVVLVSCDAAAFGRDAGLLEGAGFSRRRSVLVDLFPHTPHVEVVSSFTRQGAGTGS